MTTFDTLAICLKATPFREADQIVTFYSAQFGELRAIAKGVKKPTSKLAGACGALTLNHIYLAEGKNLHTVCHYQRVESFNLLRQDIECLAVGTVCTDIVRLLGREADPDSQVIYDLLALTLRNLDNPELSWIPSSIDFHKEMLKIAGYFLDFTRCASCEQVLDLDHSPYYPFFFSLGGFICSHCESHLKDPHRVNVSSKTLQLFGMPENEAYFENAIKAHRFLAYHWHHRIERPINSFDFLFHLIDQPVLGLSHVPK